MSRVVITGAGVASPIGTGYNDFMTAMDNGTIGIDTMSHMDTDHFPTALGGEVRQNGEVIKTDHGMDRKSMFIKTAMEELLTSNKILEKYSPENRILNMGTGIDYFDIVNFVNSEPGSPWEKFDQRSYHTVKKLAEDYSLHGGFTVNVAACVASTQSIGLSYRMIKELNERVIITGGFDSMLSPLHYIGFYKLGALSTWEGPPAQSCRPYDKNRCGLVLGEGAAAFLLENSDEADEENILAEIAGYSSTMDSYLVTDPEPEGTALAAAALEAIDEAGISPDDIDCVHLHGTATIKNELAETQAMKKIFKDRYDKIPSFSLKGQIGHLIGACGAMEILGVIYSFVNQRVPVTANYTEKDPEAPLMIIKDKPMELEINNILKLNAAFGGQNTALVFKRYGK